MLTPADSAFARRDPLLPGLATALDDTAMLTAIRSARPDCGLESVRVCYVKYKAGTKCLIGYELRIADRMIPAYAKVYRRDAADQIRKAALRRVEGPLGPGRIALEDCLALLSVFPNDQQIIALRRLADPNKRRRVLRNAGLRAKRGAEITFRPLVYKPERRCVAQIELARKGQTTRAVVKAYAPLEFETCHGVPRAFVSRDELRLPDMLAHSPSDAVVVLEWLEGRVLADAFLDPMFEVRNLAAVGRALVRLHEQRVDGLDVMTNARLADIVGSEADLLGAICPVLASRAHAVAGTLAARLEEHPPVYRALHGDFHARQVLVDNGSIGILDLDGAVAGDPLLDIGTFVAHLEGHVIRSGLAHARVEAFRDALLDGYQEATGSKIAPARVAALTAVGILRLAPQCFRYREPDWPDRIEMLLARAEHLTAATATRGRTRPMQPTQVEDPFGASDDARLPFVRSALDPEAVRVVFGRRLGLLAGDTGSVRPLSIRVTRHKPGRRCVIQYEIEVRARGRAIRRTAVIGKVRHRGTDAATFEVTRALWNAGFDGASSDGVSVPEPLGLVPEFGMWLQRKVPGTPGTLLIQGAQGDALGSRIAYAIDKVHRAAVAPTRQHTMADELRVLDGRLRALAERRPEWRTRLERLFEACARQAASVEATGATGIHRDFHPDQILIDHDRLWLLDFDLFCLGDPALDIGNFVGHVRELAVRSHGHPDALLRCETAVEDAFDDLSGRRALATVRLYTTLTLARHVSLSAELPGRAAATLPLLELCEERLGMTTISAPAACAGME